MNTKVVTIKEDHIDEEAIQEAGQILKDGGWLHFRQRQFTDLVAMH